MLQLTHEALHQTIEDASAQATARAVAQYIAEHALPPQHPCRGQDAPLAPEDRRSQSAGMPSKRMSYEEEVNSRAAQPEDNYFPPPPPWGGM
ncbi:UNVERIFIED_CONTAM: hypothetical protein Slati_1710000 [Sesamum latifolium]|uniref:Uncharacterized protein n=1 Tax=Sesamum latifolium TaxID=2727402 RepID=A0AAW2WWX8_9LAMI